MVTYLKTVLTSVPEPTSAYGITLSIPDGELTPGDVPVKSLLLDPSIVDNLPVCALTIECYRDILAIISSPSFTRGVKSKEA